MTKVYYIEYLKSEDYDAWPQVCGIFTTEEKAKQSIVDNVKPSQRRNYTVAGPLSLDEFINW